MIMFLITVPILCWCVIMFVARNPTTDWPHVEGQVIESKVTSYISGEGMNEADRRYVTKISYTYEVSGESLTGTRMSFLDTVYHKQDQAQSICDLYKVDSSVNVYYDPNNPEYSILQPGVPKSVKTAFSFTLLLFLCGLVLIVAVKFLSHRRMLQEKNILKMSDHREK